MWLEAAAPKARRAPTPDVVSAVADPTQRARLAADAVEHARGQVAEFSEIRADAIREMLASGMTMAAAGAALGISAARINDIAKGRGRT